MGIDIEIKKRLSNFCLHMSFREDSGRIGVLGASGSGKSMMLKMIAGIEKPDSGKIILDGKELYDSDVHINLKPQKRNVGYLFQNYALFPNMTVSQNIAAGLNGDKEKVRSRVSEMIQKFQLMGLENVLPGKLSGGQQQRTALARIMAYEPDMILLDEPFSALDVYLKDRMQEELMEMLSDYKGKVIMVSHSRDEIYRFSDTLLIVDDGKIINHGSTREIFARPETKAAAVLTGCKNFSRAEILDVHTIRATDWGITIKIKQEVPKNTCYIGYRAHHFVPVWGCREDNCIRFELLSKAELQFEKNFYVKPEQENFDRDAVITWFVQRDKWDELKDKGSPDYLRLMEEDMLFLK